MTKKVFESHFTYEVSMFFEAFIKEQITKQQLSIEELKKAWMSDTVQTQLNGLIKFCQMQKKVNTQTQFFKRLTALDLFILDGNKKSDWKNCKDKKKYKLQLAEKKNKK